MEKNGTRSTKCRTTTNVTRMVLVTSLYVAVMLVLSVFNFGVIQTRLSEVFSYLSLYNKRYIVAVTARVALANTAPPLGLIGVTIGSVSTLLVLFINYKITSHTKNMKIKMAVTTCVFAFSMLTVAGQLVTLYQLPSFLNWWMITLGELVSVIVGGIIIYWIGKKVDSSK